MALLREYDPLFGVFGYLNVLEPALLTITIFHMRSNLSFLEPESTFES